MAEYDIANLLSEVSETEVCGQDISYDPDFLAIEAELAPRTDDILGEEQAVKEPKWPEVADKCYDILKRSKDLRVAMYFTLALLKSKSINGFSVGLNLLEKLLDKFWDDIHPQLDPDDNNDPLERINVLTSLSPEGMSIQDPFKFKQCVMEVPLTDSRQVGRFSFKQIQVARGAISLPEDQRDSAPDSALIDAAFQDTDASYLEELFNSCESSIASLDSIDEIFSNRAYGGQSPDFSDMITNLKKIRLCLQEKLAQRGVSVVDSDGIEMGSSGVPEVATGSRGPLSGEVMSPQDAIAALDKVSRYFEKNEPSSPVPLLLKRAKKLVSKDFIGLINELCPDAISQIEMISGSTSDENSGD